MKKNTRNVRNYYKMKGNKQLRQKMFFQRMFYGVCGE